jgi:hypothetical protein
MMEDAALMLRLLTAGQMCFYTLLFAVKLSLLTLYYKLLAGLPAIFQRIWWGVVAFCVLVRPRHPRVLPGVYADCVAVLDWKCP